MLDVSITTLFSASETPYDIQVINGEGLSVVGANQIAFNEVPVFTTGAGSLGSGNGGSSVSFSVNATDPESAGNVTFEIQSGALPAGLSLTNTAAEGGTAKITGTATNPVANTTSNFVLRAVDAASNTSSRAFSIRSRVPVSQSFTSSGTFAVPAGISSLSQVLVVGGGGGGSSSNTNGTSAGSNGGAGLGGSGGLYDGGDGSGGYLNIGGAGGNNTGGGGGGNGQSNYSSWPANSRGGAGGSGIVVIAYPS